MRAACHCQVPCSCQPAANLSPSHKPISFELRVLSDRLQFPERARSISPQKSSPANTPSPRSSRQSVRLAEAPKLGSPAAVVATPSDAAVDESREPSIDPESESNAMPVSSSPTKENESPADDDVDAKRSSVSTPPARTSTLSWQRRPTSRGGSRPLSMVAAQNATQRSLAGSQEPQSATETSFSRDQIAQSLGSKDPSWFRQTPDRGQTSAAYRRNQVEDEDRSDVSAGRAQLPGMSETPPREESPSASTTPTPTQKGLASPLPLNAPRFDGPPAAAAATAAEDVASVDHPPKSPTGRTSPARTTSPTKGMGGFVQSAMMKRTDSVKRWSVQSPPGLTRADSVASTRSPYDRSRPTSMVRGGSKTPDSSRPTSQQGEGGTSLDTTPKASVVGTPPEPKSSEDDAQPVPTSPSKTMDPRRWSPTKSSWLDSALNKPESPKAQPKPFASPQPSWMAELNKTKAERHGRSGSVSHKHQVSIGGLMRSTPMGAGVKPNATDLGGIYSPPARGNRPEFGHASKPSLSKATADPSAVSKEEGEPDEKDPGTAPSEAKDVEGTPQELPRRGSVASPPATKPKPETPPKIDFRSNLKQRSADSGPTQTQEPEFKNALGNLRRAKTQNYVAPDELKNNILRGKSALNVTGGPQKSERRDEFKDAILKKKDDFKKAQAEGKGVTRRPSEATDKPLPEGLARRGELGKGAAWRKNSVSQSVSTPPQPDSPKPTPAPKRISSQTSLSSPRTPSTAQSPVKSPSPAEQPSRVSTESKGTSSPPGPRALPGLQKESGAPSRLQQGRLGGGKLADRFNPALAGMLARGPPPTGPDGRRGSGQSGSGAAPSGGDAGETPTPGPQLTHMTKGRARGPRRKAPTATATAQAPTTKEQSSPQPEPVQAVVQPSPTPIAEKKEEPEALPVEDKKSAEIPKPTEDSNEASTPAALSIQQQVAAKAALRGRPSPIQVGRSDASQKDDQVEQTRPLPLRRRPTSPEKPTAEPLSPIRPHKTGGDVSQPGSPKKLDVKRMSKFLDDSSVSSPKPEPAREPIKLSHQRTGSRSPVKTGRFELQPSSPTKVDREPVVSVRGAGSIFGGAAATKSPPPAPKPSFDSLGEAPGPGTPGYQAKSTPRPLPITPGDAAKSPPPLESPMRSPTKQASELSTVLTDFFGPQRPRRDYKVDPAELLISRPDEGSAKIKTLRWQMSQISGEGKKFPVPAHYQHTLFEREMYICAHEFLNGAGKKTMHVYFWVGDEVPESTAEDAQLFAQREARSLGGRLVKLPQGRETAEFLQSLGGIIVTRRGSSNKYDSLAPSMLCGRRHLGQVVFDEVDFSPASLCSGFPYLIAESGKCYLWKGKGATIEELSCAKLIGMDQSLMGELIEYEEGSEPDSFWELFESGGKPHSADHWRLKPNYGKYGSRLFCSDADSRQQVRQVLLYSIPERGARN